MHSFLEIEKNAKVHFVWTVSSRSILKNSRKFATVIESVRSWKKFDDKEFIIGYIRCALYLKKFLDSKKEIRIYM